MKKRITIDPITRIEGHLKIEVEIENGNISNAWSSGTLFRGFEVMLKGRTPEDAWLLTQRICGVCPVSHGHTSTIGLEDAFGVTPPDGARIIRNIIEGGQFLHSHILWFYHLTGLDYVDVVSALSARPKTKGFQAVHEKLKGFVASGQLGPFAGGWWGHPAYKLPPDLNLELVAHYLEALDMQAKASYLVAILGGKMPMHMSTPPGGVTVIPTDSQLRDLLSRLRVVKNWINKVFVSDVLAVAPYYLEYSRIGAGPGNYLAWGVFEDETRDPKRRLFPRGAIFNKVLELKDPKPDQVTEHVRHSWYKGGARNPSRGTTKPKYMDYNPDGKYSWIKAPRLNERPMEVGPLARVLTTYLSGREETKSMVDDILAKLGIPGKLEALHSILGRIASRVVEAKVIADKMEDWIIELQSLVGSKKARFYQSYQLPDRADGVGLWEAPRGALGHWSQIKNKKIKNYQCVVPTTWNASPRDGKGARGPIETALIGTPVADPDRPLEALRVVHSFDPCIACAVHIIDPKTNEIKKFQVS